MSGLRLVSLPKQALRARGACSLPPLRPIQPGRAARAAALGARLAARRSWSGLREGRLHAAGCIARGAPSGCLGGEAPLSRRPTRGWQPVRGGGPRACASLLSRTTCSCRPAASSSSAVRALSLYVAVSSSCSSSARASAAAACRQHPRGQTRALARRGRARLACWPACRPGCLRAGLPDVPSCRLAGQPQAARQLQKVEPRGERLCSSTDRTADGLCDRSAHTGVLWTAGRRPGSMLVTAAGTCWLVTADSVLLSTSASRLEFSARSSRASFSSCPLRTCERHIKLWNTRKRHVACARPACTCSGLSDTTAAGNARGPQHMQHASPA